MSDHGSVVTVTGRIDPEDVGVTLPHEHIFTSFNDDKYDPPSSAVERRMAEEPVSLDNRWWIMTNPLANKDNLRLDSMEDAVYEISRFRHAGGDTVVDVSPKNKSGDPERVRAVALETGVNIVHGTAFYTRGSHPPRIDDMTVEEIADEFVDDVRNGISGTDVRAGIIGEVGVSAGIHPQEKKVLQAGARAALRTGAPLSIHPPFDRTEENTTSKQCLEVLDLVEDEGLAPERVILCHRDQSKWFEADLTHQAELIDRGAYVEYDLFGHPEFYHVGVGDAQPSDLDRVKFLVEHIEAGRSNRLLLSHDIYMKIFLTRYGGYGYDHILRNIVPTLEREGVSSDDIDQMLVENPREILTFDSPA